MADLKIRIGITGTLHEKVLACMQRIRPAMVGGLRGLLIDVAGKTTRRASGGVINVRSGHLRRTIGPPSVRETATGAAGELTVGAKYGPFLEYGTRPYRIVPRRGKALRFLDRAGKVRFATSVQHPGLRPRPFFHPSWNDVMEGGRARARLATILQQTINEA